MDMYRAELENPLTKPHMFSLCLCASALPTWTQVRGVSRMRKLQSFLQKLPFFSSIHFLIYFRQVVCTTLKFQGIVSFGCIHFLDAAAKIDFPLEVAS